jgi:hypothetical protein
VISLIYAWLSFLFPTRIELYSEEMAGMSAMNVTDEKPCWEFNSALVQAADYHLF